MTNDTKRTMTLLGTWAAALVMMFVMPLRAVAADMPLSEWAIDARVLFPERTEHWEGAGGLDLQFLFWQNEHFALSLGLGIQSWQGLCEYYVDADADSTLEFVSGGEATVLPLGASLHYRIPLSSQVGVVLEAGLRYLVVDSQLTIDTYLTDSAGSTMLQDVVEIDDTVAAVFGVRVEAPLADSVRLFLGFGIQRDLGEPEESVYGEPLDKTSFDAGYISLGASVVF